MDRAVSEGRSGPATTVPVMINEAPAPALVPSVSCLGLAKAFGGVPVLRDITVDFHPGTVNVLAGENGAGKSTLFKLISGQLHPDAGTLALQGHVVHRFDPRHARSLGVSIIPQELAPLPDMRLWQNLLIGREICGPFGIQRRSAMRDQAAAMLRSVELDLDPDTPMKALGTAPTQMVEILKATSRNARIVLMDEPSSSLSSRETEQLFRVIRTLRTGGVCILYTSHRMEEIEEISDTVSIMRDGGLVRHVATASITEAEIITSMVGRELTELFPGRSSPSPTAPVVLQVDDFLVKGAAAPLSFSIRAGEIVGLGGLVGAGRSELLEALFGLRPATGRLRLNGDALAAPDMREMIRRGVALVPEDRKLAGNYAFQ